MQCSFTRTPGAGAIMVAHATQAVGKQNANDGRTGRYAGRRFGRTPKLRATPLAPKTVGRRPPSLGEVAQDLARIESLPPWRRLAQRPAYERGVVALEAATARKTLPFDRLDDRLPHEFAFVFSDIHWPFFLPVDERLRFDIRNQRMQVETRLGPLRLTFDADCTWTPQTRILEFEFAVPRALQGSPFCRWLVDRVLNEKYRFTYNYNGRACMRARNGHLTVMRRVALGE